MPDAGEPETSQNKLKSERRLLPDMCSCCVLQGAVSKCGSEMVVYCLLRPNYLFFCRTKSGIGTVIIRIYIYDINIHERCVKCEYRMLMICDVYLLIYIPGRKTSNILFATSLCSVGNIIKTE